MIDLTDLILVIPKLLSSEECKRLIEEYENSIVEPRIEGSAHAITNEILYSTFKVKEIPKQTKNYNLAFEKIEISLNHWVNHLKKFNAFEINALKRNLNYPHKIRLLKYETGASVHPHSDFSDYCFASCTLNLNSNYTGGDFCFFNKQFNLQLGEGDAIIFPNNHFFVHEVDTITSGIRYSINTFITSIPANKQLTIYKLWREGATTIIPPEGKFSIQEI